MTVDDGQDDRFLDIVASLRTYDVSQRRTRQLRRRCHAVLQADHGRRHRRGWWMRRLSGGSSFRRSAARGVSCIWLRSSATQQRVYGYLGTQ